MSSKSRRVLGKKGLRSVIPQLLSSHAPLGLRFPYPLAPGQRPLLEAVQSALCAQTPRSPHPEVGFSSLRGSLTAGLTCTHTTHTQVNSTKHAPEPTGQTPHLGAERAAHLGVEGPASRGHWGPWYQQPVLPRPQGKLFCTRFPSHSLHAHHAWFKVPGEPQVRRIPASIFSDSGTPYNPPLSPSS